MTVQRTLPALSIRQPWAWLIVSGIKDIENRTWNTNYRGAFLVHASKTLDAAGIAWVRDKFDIFVPEPDDFQRGGIVGIVELVDVVTAHNSAWFEGPYGFVLANPRPIRFMSARGQMGFFQISIDDTQLLLD